MAKLIATLLFISVVSPIIVSAIQNENLAKTLDKGVKIINDIKDRELALTVYRAQMLLLGYRLSNEMEKLSKKLRSGDATQQELDKLSKDTMEVIDQVHLVEDTEISLILYEMGKDSMEVIDQVHLVEDTESSLIGVAVKSIFSTAEDAQKQIKEIKS